MKKIAFLTALIAVAVADYHPISKEIIEEIKAKAQSW